MHLLGGGLDAARVSQDNLGIVVARVLHVDHDAVEHAGLDVLMLHEEVVAGYLAVEHAFRYLQFGRLLLHRVEQGVETAVGCRRDVVLEIERTEHGHEHEEQYGPEDAHQRDA